MIKPIFSMLKKHSSLLVMGLGAFSVFMANVGLKSVLNYSQYYEYSVLVTVLTLLTSFGALGLDQVFLRLSEVEHKNKIIFDSKLIPLAIFNSLITSFIAYYYLAYLIEIKEHGLIIFISCFGSIWIMLFYNVLRLASFFFVSQLIQNSWKILFGILVGLVFLNKGLYAYFFIILSVFIFVVVLLTIVYLRRNIDFIQSNKYSKKKILSYSFHFFLALLTLSFLSQGDRIFVERLFTKEEFGDYFYLATLFLFPFSLFQSYIGFKELVYIKNERMNIRKKLRAIIFGSLLFSLVLFSSILFLSKFNFLNLDFQNNLWLIIVFLIIGNIKMVYSLFSAVIGARATLKEIKTMNIIFISISFLILLVSWSFIESLITLIAMFSILWFIRLIIWWYFSKTHISNEN